MRRISSATRWMAGIGLGLTAALTGFFAARAQHASTTTSTPSSADSQVSQGDDGSGTQSPSAQAPDNGTSNNGGTNSGGSSSGNNGFSFPRPHTRSGGS